MATFDSVVDAGPGWTTVRTSDGRTVTLSGARNWRNNNPGNLEYGPFARGSGAIGTDSRFAVFPDYNTGRTAKESLLFANPRYADLTIADAIARYAPPVENNTTGYVNSITRALGVPADTPLSSLNTDQRNVMMDAMERVEGFRTGQATGILGDPLDPETMQISPEYGAVPESVPTPTPRPGLDQQSSAFGIMDAINPASTMPVERGLLSAPAPATDPSMSVGFGPEAAMSTEADVPAFDQSRFGPISSVPETFDVGRFGPMTGMNYDAMAGAMQQPATAAVSSGSGLLGSMSPISSAQAAEPAGLLGTPAPAGLAEQYSQYGMGRQALLADLGYQQQVSAANLAQDVAAINPNIRQPVMAAPPAPASPTYVDPMVTTQTAPVQAIEAASPMPAMSVTQSQSAPVSSVTPQGAALGKQVDSALRTRGILGSVGGALLGGALLGPVGGLLGGYLGRNAMQRSYYPAAPASPTGSRQKDDRSYGGLNDRGRDTYRDSGQFRDAVDKGSAGLW